MKYLQLTRCFFNLIGTRNWYIGIDKPNFWESIYKWRLSAKSSFKLSKNIWLNQ